MKFPKCTKVAAVDSQHPTSKQYWADY